MRVGSSGAFWSAARSRVSALGILFAQDEQVRETGAGGGGIGIFGEDAAIGGCGGVVLAGFLSQFGGEQRVRGCLRRELEGLEQIV